MEPIFTFRNVKKSDVSDIDKLNRENLPENYSQEDWEYVLKAHGATSFVALNESKIVAYCIAIRLKPETVTIASIAVDKNFRRHKLGIKLMLKSMVAAKKLITTPFTFDLHCRQSNEPAKKLYRRLGFKIERVVPNYYENPVENAFLFVK